MSDGNRWLSGRANILLSLVSLIFGGAIVVLTFGPWIRAYYESTVLPDLSLQGMSNAYGNAHFDSFGEYTFSDTANTLFIGLIVAAPAILVVISSIVFASFPQLRSSYSHSQALIMGVLVAIILSGCLYSMLNRRDFFAGSETLPQSTEYSAGSGLLGALTLSIILGILLVVFAVLGWRARNLQRSR